MYDYDPQPKVPFPYVMKTTGTLPTSNGIAWTADLILNGKTVGAIEQHGNGGPDLVMFGQNADRLAWKKAVEDSFDGVEEDATFWMLVQEEEAQA